MSNRRVPIVRTPPRRGVLKASSLNSVCGRPLQGDLASFQPLGSDSTPVPGVGDPNYGYIINPDLWSGTYGCPSGTTLVTSLPSQYYIGPQECQYPQGVTSTGQPNGPVMCPIADLPGAPPGCGYPWIPSGCVALMPNYNISGNENPVMCANSWTTQSSTINRALGCSGMAYDSSTVLPDACPLNTDWCPGLMAEVCTSDTWGTGSLESSTCDAYASSARGIPSGNGSLDATANLVSSALTKWATSGGKPTDDSPFISKAITWCQEYPGLCDSVLTGVCAAYSSEDLAPQTWKGRRYDPHGTNALQMCGCFLPSKEYVSTIPKQCNASCAFPGAIPLSVGGAGVLGPPAQCSTTECAIDQVVVDYVNSTSSTITLSQVCGKPNNNACYFNGISANDPQDPDVQVQIATTCSTCFDYNPQTFQATRVPCPGQDSTSVVRRRRPRAPKPPPRRWTGWWVGGVVIVGLGLLGWVCLRSPRPPPQG